MKLTPDSMKEWAWAVCISLIFVSCGVSALVDVVGDMVQACRGRQEVAP